MIRSRPSVCLLLLAGFAMFSAHAQDEGPWRQYVTEALKAAEELNYALSEHFFVKALREAETFGANDVRVASTLNSLGLVYRAEKKYSEAEASYRRALTIMDAAYGDNLDVANVNFNVANVMFDQGHQAEALPSVEKALRIYEKLLGGDSMKTAAALCMEGDAERLRKNYSESEANLRRCSVIREKDAGLESNDVADAQYSLSLTLMAEGKYSMAEPRLRLVEAIREKTLGITSPVLADTMERHAAVLRQLGRASAAQKLDIMAAAIRHSQSRAR
jgi:tetratricopeptide (TPR) repeat protein